MPRRCLTLSRWLFALNVGFPLQWDSSESEYSESEESNELGAIASPETCAMDTVDSTSKRQATRVFKKSSVNGKITVYLGKRDFVDHITHVDPIGKARACKRLCETARDTSKRLDCFLVVT